MKKLALVLSVMVLAMFSLFMGGEKKDKTNENMEGDMDEEMAGPRGEEIFIGANGGRYFLKDGKKIYVGYKRKKEEAGNQ